MNINIQPIGHVHSTERGPREDFWGEVHCEIELDRNGSARVPWRG